MVRFILLTFGFLAWAFYEMSGGADFESASAKQARLNPAPAVTVAKVDPEPLVLVDEPEVIDTDPPQTPEVTRVSLNLTSLQSTLDAEEAVETAAAAAVPANIDPNTGVAVNTITSGDTPAIIPSLINPQDTGAAVQQALLSDESVGNIRTVSGSRVNVRGGPGTDFGVVGKLAQGDAVEVLEENGDGWVRMRSIDTGAEGWMADFLLNAG